MMHELVDEWTKIYVYVSVSMEVGNGDELKCWLGRWWCLHRCNMKKWTCPQNLMSNVN